MTTDPLAIQMPDGSYAPAARDMGDGSFAPVCSVDGAAPCCCDGEVACCGTGNQCRLWQVEDLRTTAFSPACLTQAFLDTVPHRNRFEGWSRLGVAFDVVQTIQIDRERTSGQCFSAQLFPFSAEFVARRVRFRLVPGTINPDTPDGQQAIVDAVGPTLHPGGRWQRGYPIFAYTPNGSGGYTSTQCGEIFVDEGIFNGSMTWNGQTRSFVDASIFDVLATNPPVSLGQNTSFFRVPVDRQAFVQTVGGPISPLQYDGMAWTGSPFIRTGGEATTAILIYNPKGTNSGCANLRAFVAAERRGGNASQQGTVFFTPAQIETAFTVDHSENAAFSVVQTATSLSDGCSVTVNFTASYRLERVGPACPGYADLPPNACAPPGFEARIGRRCDDDTAVIPYATASRPSPASAWPTFLFQGERYIATDEETTVDPVAVEWSQEQCPGPVGEFMVATKCFLPTSDVLPEEIVVEVNPGVGLGAGVVRFLAFYPNPACPDSGDRCTVLADYRPTTTKHPGPATPNATHLAGVPCTQPDQVRCRACPVDGDGQEPIRNPNQNPAGNDPMGGFRAAWQCKGCGDAGLDGIL